MRNGSMKILRIASVVTAIPLAGTAAFGAAPDITACTSGDIPFDDGFDGDGTHNSCTMANGITQYCVLSVGDTLVTCDLTASGTPNGNWNIWLTDSENPSTDYFEMYVFGDVVDGGGESFCCRLYDVDADVQIVDIVTGAGDDWVFGFGYPDPLAPPTLGTATAYGGTTPVFEYHVGNGADEVEGSRDASATDRMFGNSGGDTLQGWEGDDEIDGGNDADFLYGDVSWDLSISGDDTILGGGGNDFIGGGPGSDVLDGEGGNDDIFGFEGDPISGCSAGTDGADIIVGNFGLDALWGCGGADLIIGGVANSGLTACHSSATDSADTIRGGDGDDDIRGCDGNDVLYGESGVDSVQGGGDNDYISGGTGNDVMSGGNNSDILCDRNSGDQYTGDAGDDVIWHDTSTSASPSVLNGGSHASGDECRNTAATAACETLISSQPAYCPAGW